MQQRVLIGVPAYRGAEHIGETLRSIAEQELASFEVSISIDNADRETAIACEPFLSDPRFRMVVHDKRLGWDGNINWLMSQCTAEFFCYWQQDDTATKDYLLSLIAFANANPTSSAPSATFSGSVTTTRAYHALPRPDLR